MKRNPPATPPPDAANTAAERVWFAHDLRGIAAVLVVLSHLAGVFWFRPDAVYFLLGWGAAPAVPRTDLPSVLHWGGALPLVDCGQLGVSLFFLISGFVIPFSLCRLDRKQFAVARVLRIYPTYWCALAITLLAIRGGALLVQAGEVPSVTVTAVLRQMLLIRDWFWVPPLDAVSWSLEIEIKFYLICLLTAGWLRRGRLLPLLLLASGLAALSLLARHADLSGPVKWSLVLQYNLPTILYMFIGVVLNLLYRKKIGAGAALAAGAYFYALTLLTIARSQVLESAFGAYAFNYTVSLTVFVFCYLIRDRAPRFRPLTFLADISYPLYAVHAIAGFVLLEALLRQGLYPAAAIAVTLMATGFVAWLLHLAVENPTLKLGKALARRMRR